jgi:TRAP-type C4-dicarboxylate transport system substrate-binding protein
MKRIAVTTLLLLLPLLWVPTAAAEDFELTIATVAPEGSLWMKEMHKLDEKVREKTDGHVRFKFYPGGVAGDDKTVLEKIKGGQFVGAGLTGVGLGEIYPGIRVLEIPFTFRSYGEVDYVLKKLSKYFKQKFEEKGFKVLGWTDQGFVYIMSKQKIASKDDMKKAKPWVWDVDPLANAAFASFGINPIPLSIENVATSLDSGMIDTFYISPVAAIALQWYRKAKFVVNFPVVDGAGAIVIAKETFDKMPKEYQVILETLSAQYLRGLSVKTRKANDQAMETLKKKGIEIVEPTEADVKEFMEVGIKASDSLAGKLYSKKLLDKVRALLDDYRKK